MVSGGGVSADCTAVVLGGRCVRAKEQHLHFQLVHCVVISAGHPWMLLLSVRHVCRQGRQLLHQRVCLLLRLDAWVSACSVENAVLLVAAVPQLQLGRCVL